jgi:hypothetical protein
LWRFGGNTFDFAPAETFFSDFYRPGLLSQILQGKHPTATVDIRTIDRRQPSVTIESTHTSTSGPVNGREVQLRLSVSQAPPSPDHESGSGVRDLRLFRNGTLVKSWHGEIQLNDNGTATLETRATLVTGENRFVAYAFSRSNIKSSDATLTVNANMPQHKGTLYILAIGVNRYADPAVQPLRDAVSDVEDFSESLAKAQTKLQNYLETVVVRLEDRDATRADILAALDRLAGRESGPLRPGQAADLVKIQPAQPEDVIFIDYSGHGAVVKDDPHFYLLAHDYTEREDKRLSGVISEQELGNAIEGIDARQVVLVIDSCYSGQSLEAEDPRQGPMNSRGLAQLAYDKGMYILAASQSDQAALELRELGHGLLTYALVEEGLNQGKADVNHDGQILLREWLDYPRHALPGLQHGVLKLGDNERTASRKQAAAAPSPQRPRIFYRRDPDVKPFVVAKP